MRRIDLTAATDEELVGHFIAAAKEMGAAVLDSANRQANRMYYYMRAIDFELRARGVTSRLKLAPLLDDRDRFVRYYAAQKLLALIPDRSRSIIEDNHNHWFDAIAGDAGMLLRAVDSGEYTPD